MKSRRRGVFLVEMLTVLLLLGAGTTLMAVAIGSMFHSQQRLARAGNRFAQVNDLLTTVSRDVRRSTSAVVEQGQTAGVKLLRLTLGDNQDLVYRLSATAVERDALATADVAPKSWPGIKAEARILPASSEGGGRAVSVTVHWSREDTRDPEPNRRFDLVVRCAGEHTDEAE